MTIADPVTTSPYLHACYPRILLMLNQAPRHGPLGCHGYIYMAFTSDQRCEYGNQFYVSFGLVDRYLILIVTKCYRDI